MMLMRKLETIHVFVGGPNFMKVSSSLFEITVTLTRHVPAWPAKWLRALSWDPEFQKALSWDPAVLTGGVVGRGTRPPTGLGPSLP